MRRKLTILRSALIATTVLLSATPLLLSMGQSRAGQRGRGSTVRNPEAPAESNRGSQPVAPPGTTRRAGNDAPPEGGYVAMPENAPPGSVTPPLIPDMADRSFWTLYDRDRSITISGTVNKVEWTNPNSYIFLQANGQEWAVEASFIHFRQSSSDPPLKPGHTITVFGYFPKDDPPEISPRRTGPSVTRYVREDLLIRAGEITTAFGQKLIMGKPPTEKEEAEREKCRPFGC